MVHGGGEVGPILLAFSFSLAYRAPPRFMNDLVRLLKFSFFYIDSRVQLKLRLLDEAGDSASLRAQ
jgi:hypothetical protein